MFIFGISLPQNELVVEQDNLAVDVLDDDPERLGTTVDLLVPLEVGGYREFYAGWRSYNGLNSGL